jgi:hypothetical protein
MGATRLAQSHVDLVKKEKENLKKYADEYEKDPNKFSKKVVIGKGEKIKVTGRFPNPQAKGEKISWKLQSSGVLPWDYEDKYEGKRS